MGFIDVKQASTYMSIKIKTLYAWASQGRMPYYRINGLLRFKKEELDSWMEGCKHMPEDLEQAAKQIVEKNAERDYNSTCGKPASRNRGLNPKLRRF